MLNDTYYGNSLVKLKIFSNKRYEYTYFDDRDCTG